jgi:hypothetical protein
VIITELLFFVVVNIDNMFTWLHLLHIFLSVAQSARVVFSVIDLENVM